MFVTGSKAIISQELAKEVKLAQSVPDIFMFTGVGFLCLGALIIVLGLFFIKNEETHEHTELPQKIDINNAVEIEPTLT